jgi:hypothetical protein
MSFDCQVHSYTNHRAWTREQKRKERKSTVLGIKKATLFCNCSAPTLTQPRHHCWGNHARCGYTADTSLENEGMATQKNTYPSDPHV